MKINAGIEKILKNVVKNVDDTRPILQCAHLENGNIVVTDSNQLVRFRNMVPKDLKFNLNLKNFTFEDRIYPETENLIPTEFATEFEINTNTATELLPLLKSPGNNCESITNMLVNENGIILKTKLATNGTIKQQIGIDVEKFKGEEVNVNFKTKLLILALESVKELDSFENIEFKFQNNQLRPFLLVYKNMDYLITQTRVF